MPASFTRSAVIERSPEVAFAYAVDTDRVREWMPEISSLERLDDGPVKLGSRFRETRLMKGKAVTAEIEVVAHDGPPTRTTPPYTHAGRASAMGVEGTYTLTFHADGPGRTRVELLAEARATSFLAKPLVGMIVKAMEQSDGDQLQRLKTAVERDTPADHEAGA